MPKNKFDRRSKTIRPLRYLNEDYIPGYFRFDGAAFSKEKCAYYVGLYSEKFSIPAIENPIINIKVWVQWLIYMKTEIWREDPKKIKTLANQMSILRYLQDLPNYTQADIELLCQRPYRHNYLAGYYYKFSDIFEFLNAGRHYAETSEVPPRIEQVLGIRDENFSEEEKRTYFAFLREMTIDCIRNLMGHALEHFERIFPSLDFAQEGIVDTRELRPAKVLSARRVRFFEPVSDENMEPCGDTLQMISPTEAVCVDTGAGDPADEIGGGTSSERGFWSEP